MNTNTRNSFRKQPYLAVVLILVLVLASCATRAIHRGDQPDVDHGSVYFVASLIHANNAIVLIGKQGELYSLPKARIDLKQGKQLYAVFLDSNNYEFNTFDVGKIDWRGREQVSIQPKNPEHSPYENLGYCDPFSAKPGTLTYAGSIIFEVEADGFKLYCDRSDSAKQSATNLFNAQFPELKKRYQVD